MFSKEIIKHLAGNLGLSVKDFQAQFADEKEIAVKLPAAPAKVFKTAEDFETYNTNLKAPEYGRGVDDGKKNSTEVFIKKIKDSEGLELTNSQLTEAGLLGALKTKYGSDNKDLIKQFETEKTGWLEKIATSEKTLSDKLAENEKATQRLRLRTESITGVKNKTKFDKFDGIDLIMKDISVEKDAAGKEFIHYKGVAQKDDKLEPLAMSIITDNVFIDKKWYEEGKGRGKGNEHGAGGTTSMYKDFVKEMDEKGIRHGSAAYGDELDKRMEDKEFMKSVNEAE